MGTLRLDIDAHVVRQLGEELITDAEQALLELVKNAYDADAEWCNVTIDTRHVEHVEREIPEATLKNDDATNPQATTTLPPKETSGVKDARTPTEKDKVTLSGRIIIEDNGCGMPMDVIERGWLVISVSPKRKMKALGQVTDRFKRTPLGDKGLGRLGTMKLGNRLKIETYYSPDKPGKQVILYWKDCQSGKPLGAIPVEVKDLTPIGKTGTTIEIGGLSDLDLWKGNIQQKRLEDKLSTLISPFRGFEHFTVALESDGVAIDLVSFPKRFFDTALGTFEFLWDNNELDLQGRVKLDILKGNLPDDLEFYSRYILIDNGADFLSYLIKHRFASRWKMKKSNARSWFVDFSDLKDWSLIYDVTQKKPASNPGPFMGELHMFGMDRRYNDIQTIAKSTREYTQRVKALAGVYVYRDNFRIRLGEDWLDLGGAWTSGSSWYGIRPNNTLGYFAVSSRDNPELVEKSDREGFVDNNAKNGFDIIAKQVKDFANGAVAAVRRCYIDYRSEKRKCAESDSPTAVISAKEGAEKIAKLIQISDDVSAKVHASSLASVGTLKKAQSELRQSMSSEKLPPNLKEQFASMIEEIERLILQLPSENDELQAFLAELTDKKQHAAIILDRFEQFEEQLSEVYETVGLGLAAQALAHEIHPSIDEISSRIRGINNRLKKLNIQDPPIAGDLEYIRSHSVMIGKKLAFIDPMLRTFRETKHDITLSDFLKDFFQLRKSRFEGFGITTHLECSKGEDIQLKVNKGRLSQIIDNLARNSEYWLRKAGLERQSPPLEMHASIDCPRLAFWDNGPGVRLAMEEVCFDIFATDKPKGEGHGLGLFITRQLLEDINCHIFLSEERNANERLFKFVVDFSGAMKE